MAAVVCYVDGYEAVENGRRGIVILTQVSDVNYMVQFVECNNAKDEYNIVITVDLDDIEIGGNDDDTNMHIKFIDKSYGPVYRQKRRAADTTNATTSSSSSVSGTEAASSSTKLPLLMKVIIPDPSQFKLLVDAISECTSLCELSLRWESVLRDIYYSGVYSSSLSKDSKHTFRNELLALHEQHSSDFQIFRKNQNGMLHSHTPSGGSTSSSSCTGTNAATTGATSDDMSKSIKNFELNNKRCEPIHCCFCDASSHKDGKYDKNGCKFVYHPYVHKNFDNVDIFLCTTCVQNWKQFRSLAAQEDRLILLNEINEEICAVCSDSPPELVMCCQCPRSYCNGCLIRLLNTKQLDVMNDETVEWCCMCCTMNLDAIANMVEATWTPLVHHNNAWISVNPKKADKTNKNNTDRKTITDSNKSKRTRVAKVKTDHIYESSNKITHYSNATTNSNDNDDGEYSVVETKRNRHNITNSSNSSSSSSSSSVRKNSKAELPPVNQELDEIYYFGQYIKFYDRVYKPLAKVSTDDVCFLCKDGGELVECDYKPANGSKRSIGTSSSCGCRKVYHTYCLAYAVVDEQEWICPRHYCDICGSKKLQYVCKYCTISICKDCPESIVSKFGLSRYMSKASKYQIENYDTTAEMIVCHNCLDMYECCKKRGDIPKSFQLNGEEATFPGAYKPSSKAINACGVFKKGIAAHDVLVATTTRGSKSKGRTVEATSSSSSSSSSRSSSSRFHNKKQDTHRKQSVSWTVVQQNALLKGYQLYGNKPIKITSDDTIGPLLSDHSFDDVVERLAKLIEDLKKEEEDIDCSERRTKVPRRNR